MIQYPQETVDDILIDSPVETCGVVQCTNNTTGPSNTSQF